MRSRQARPTVAAALVASVALLAGCSVSAGQPGSGGDRTLTVLAASSLTGSFGDLAKTFEKQHPGVHVRFSFDSSATLAEQVTQGAPADVLATADARTMRTVVEAKANAGKPRLFATNKMVLVVPKDNPAHIRRFADIGRPGVSYVMCVPSAPCGSLGKTLLRANHVHAEPKSQEIDVKSVLGKVQLGEADAGLVYATDAKADSGHVTPVRIPQSSRHINNYPIVALKGAREPGLARDWVRLVLSAKGRRVLRAAAFGSP